MLQKVFQKILQIDFHGNFLKEVVRLTLEFKNLDLLALIADTLPAPILLGTFVKYSSHLDVVALSVALCAILILASIFYEG